MLPNLQSVSYKFYTFVDIKRNSIGFPSVMKFANQKLRNDKVLCDMFDDFFACTYSNVVYNGMNSYSYSLL